MLRLGSARVRSFVFCLSVFAWGCGPGSQPITENPLEGAALSDIGEAYRTFTITKKRPPAKLDDLTPMEMACPTGVRALKKGEAVVRWGATLPDTGEEPGKVPAPEVLAYVKNVPEQGGYVLLLDRTIRKMTADEFKAAPKAGKD